MRVLVVVNPNATTTTLRTRDVLLAALHDKLAIDVLVTQHRGHATEAAAQARHDGYTLVVAHGGDGTVNEVVNGLLAAGVGPDVPLLGIVPGGRTNVLSRNLGIADNPVEATGQLLDAVRDGQRRTLGLGKADDRWFTFNAGLGLDAAVVHAVERARAKGKTSTHALYIRSAFIEYFRKTGPSAAITRQRPGTEDVTGLDLALITNCSPWTYLGDRAVVATPLASFDAGLDFVGLRDMNPARTLKHAAKISVTSRGPKGKDLIAEHDLDEFTLVADKPTALQVDGDYLGEVTRIRFESVPSALTVLA